MVKKEPEITKGEYIEFFQQNKNYILSQLRRKLINKGIISILITDITLEEDGLPEEIEYGSYIPLVISYRVNEDALLNVFNYTPVPGDENNNMFVCKLSKF